MNLCFFDDGHRYTIDTRPVPCVTDVLRDVGVSDFYGEDEVAMMRGRYVHKATVLVDDGTLDWDSLDDKIRGYVESYVKTREKYPFVVLESERVVGSKLYGFAGTLDRVIDDGRRGYSLVDIKTGGKSRADAIQTAGYAFAYEETAFIKVRERFCMYLKKDGGLGELSRPFTDPNDRNVFLSALVIHNWAKSARK